MLGVDERTVSTYQTLADPLPVLTPGRGRRASTYDPRAVVEWYSRKRLKEEIQSGHCSPEDLEAARTRLATAQAENVELKNAQLRNELAPIDMITWTLGKVGAQIAALLETIPGRVKRRSPDLSARHIDIIKGEIIKAQNMAARVSVNLQEYRSAVGKD